MVWPAIIAAGAALAGSAISARSQREANQDNERLQREFAQQGIRWKVEDAKAAGLHPLFALGGAGATYTPSAQPVFDSSLGQNLSRAATAFSEREVHAAQLEALKAGAAKDRALAAAADSEAARNRQALTATAPVAESFPVYLPGQAVDSVSLNGGPYVSVNERPLPPLKHPPAYLAPGGAEPGFKAFNVPGVGEVILPNAQTMSEAVESLENPVLQSAVAAANAAHYGDAGLQRVKRLAGKWWSDPLGAGVDWLRDRPSVAPYVRR